MTGIVGLESIQSCVKTYCKVKCRIIYTCPSLCFNPCPNKPWFLHVCSRTLLKTVWEKEKLLLTSNFSFSHHVFYPLGELSAILIKHKIVVCKMSWLGSLKFVILERVNIASVIHILYAGFFFLKIDQFHSIFFFSF